MGFMKSPKIPPYIPPPPPPPAPASPIDEEQQDFSKIPLSPDLPQSPDEVQARTRALQKAMNVRRRRLGTGGLRIPLDTTGVSV